MKGRKGEKKRMWRGDDRMKKNKKEEKRYERKWKDKYESVLHGCSKHKSTDIWDFLVSKIEHESNLFLVFLFVLKTKEK